MPEVFRELMQLLWKRNVQGWKRVFPAVPLCFLPWCWPWAVLSYQHWALQPRLFPNTTAQSNAFKVCCVTGLFRPSRAFLVLLYLLLYKQCTSKYSNWEKSMSYSGHKSLLSKLMELLAHGFKMGHVDCGAREQSIAQSIWGEKIREM